MVGRIICYDRRRKKWDTGIIRVSLTDSNVITIVIQLYLLFIQHNLALKCVHGCGGTLLY